MRVQVQGRAEALDQGGRAGSRPGRDGQPRVSDHKGGEGALHHGEHGRQGLGLGGEQKAQGKREGQHPLSDRCFRKHVIDQVGGRLHHAACAATGAEAPALATERHQMLVTAAIALYAQEPMLQQPALQVVLELLPHKPRQGASGLFNRLNEVRVMLGNNGVEGGLFRPMAVVGRGSRNRRRSKHQS